MKLYSENENYKLYHGSMLDMLEIIEPNSIDSIVCDPPYGLTSITKRFGKENSAPAQFGKDGSFARLSKGFMGKEWDGSGIEYNIEAWSKCYEVLKPGGYLLAFGGSRTFHRIACTIEDAGFEIRDTIMWLYGSGFPKSQNISKILDKKFGFNREIVGITNNAGIAKDAPPDATGSHKWSGNLTSNEPICSLAKQWQGWGTCLKPAYEPIIVARKPFKGSLVDNIIEYGVGGLNIDECRVGNEERFNPKATIGKDGIYNWNQLTNENEEYNGQLVNGRFPANVIHDGSEEVIKDMPIANGESVSRYFYCAKASKKDRDEGLDEYNEHQISDGCIRSNSETARKYGANPVKKKNIHPTVKPTELMQYLIRLVSPKGATILDPFNGSGSTGKAVIFENKERNADYKYIGIELTEEYLPIAKARIEFADSYKEEIENNKDCKAVEGQLTIDDLLEV